MEVNYELLQRGCDRAREIRLKQERIREATQERKASEKFLITGFVFPLAVRPF